MPGHFINGAGNYIIVGTNEPYSGLVVKVGGKLYTTKGGTFEGNSQEVHPLNHQNTLPTVEDVVTDLNQKNRARTQNVNTNQSVMNRSTNQRMMNGNGNGMNNRTTNNNRNPVTSTGIALSGQYEFLDGSPVPQGTQIHTHRDGTIMLGHDPNAMGEIIRLVSRPTQNRNTVRRPGTTTPPPMNRRARTQRRRSGRTSGRAQMGTTMRGRNY